MLAHLPSVFGLVTLLLAGAARGHGPSGVGESRQLDPAAIPEATLS